MKIGSATSGKPGVDVAPAIADHEARREIDAAVACGVRRSRPGLGLRHAQCVGIVVKAGVDRVERQLALQPIVDRVDRRARLRATRHIGLVRDDDQLEAGGAELRERLGNAGQDLQLVRRSPADTACRRARPRR